MMIYYDSKTGNVGRFIEKVHSQTGWPCLKISDSTEAAVEGHLVTYTTKIGQVSETTSLFMKRNHRLIRSVSSSGNRNWGPSFAAAADILSQAYGIPLFLKFELAGLDREVTEFIQKITDDADQKMDTPQ